MPNNLLNETSPYLLQHAHNPVNWYPWGEEALNRAEAEDKPILVSIGYAACHWCHVMERESFENEATAAIMNEHFINIKIDREERPDLDHIYMDALQAMSGNGGWPLNVFLTPDRKPFFGGTYYPPVKAFNRSSWTEVLQSVNTAFQTKRQEVDAQAQNLVAHLQNANQFGAPKPGANLFTEDNLQLMATAILQTGDKEWGGFGHAPKFPQTFSIRFLLNHYHHTKQQEALDQALLSLDKMIQGGIYDQVGGGFARYSTDKEWQAPHFEKMLYDNALLISALAEAYQLTGRPRYKEVIEQTLAFIERELLSPQFGFYSALDADSEGVEGKFYTWQLPEIEALLGNDAALFAALYQLTPEGNWHEGNTNILWLGDSIEAFAKLNQLDVNELKDKIQTWNALLLKTRSQRVRPLLDDKVLLGWNALMITAYVDAHAATGNDHYRQIAEKSIDFLENNLHTADGWKHTWKNEARYPAFLDDYAMLIQAYTRLQEITGNSAYLHKAAAITHTVMNDFCETESGFFYFTHRHQQDVVVRKKEVYDGATPSGNALMATNLAYLGIIYNKPEWIEQAGSMITSLGQTIVRYPGSFGCWGALLQHLTYGFNEIAVVGENAGIQTKKLILNYLPGKVLQQAKKENQEFPLLQNRTPENNNTYLYLCKNYTCHQPTTSINEFLSRI